MTMGFSVTGAKTVKLLGAAGDVQVHVAITYCDACSYIDEHVLQFHMQGVSGIFFTHQHTIL